MPRPLARRPAPGQARARLARRAGALALAAWLTGSGATAHAWTRASVESAEAHVTLEGAARARVALALTLRVHGGWLSRFELTGLGSGLELDPSRPASIVSDDGRSFAPEVHVDARGRAVFSFPDRHAAPRRGAHRLALFYTTSLGELEPDAAGKLAIGWSLPAWEADLQTADIWLDAPAGARLAASESDADAAVQRQRVERDGRTLFHLQRSPLPRTVAFGFELELPAGAAVAAPVTPHAPPGQHLRPTLAASALLLGLLWLKRRAVRAASRRHGVRPRPLVPLSARTRGACSLALATAAALVYEPRPGLGLGLFALLITLGLERGFAARPSRAPQARTGAPVPAPASPAPRPRLAARCAQLFATDGWLDATGPLGLGLLCSAYALAALRIALGVRPGLWLETLILVTPLWLTGTRLQMAGDRVSRVGAGRPAPDRAA